MVGKGKTGTYLLFILVPDFNGAPDALPFLPPRNGIKTLGQD